MRKGYIKFLYLFIIGIIFLPLGLLSLAYEVLKLTSINIAIINLLGGWIAIAFNNAIGYPYVGGALMALLGGVMLKIGWD